MPARRHGPTPAEGHDASRWTRSHPDNAGQRLYEREAGVEEADSQPGEVPRYAQPSTPSLHVLYHPITHKQYPSLAVLAR